MMGLRRGEIQALQQEASTFCGMATIFCSKLKWLPLSSLLSSFHAKLGPRGGDGDLGPLLRLGMPSFRARALFKSGICGPHDIVKSPPEKIAKLLVDQVPFDSRAPMHAGQKIYKKRRLKGSGASQSLNEEKENFGLAQKNAIMKTCTHLAIDIIQRAQRLVDNELAVAKY